MKKLYFLFLCCSFGLKSQNVSSDSLINFAKKQLGIRYSYGNCSPKTGFDCSGFVFYTFNHFEIKVPRASLDYEKQGLIIPLDSAKQGDVIVFTGTNIKNRKPGHVGIVLSNPGEEMRFIHSSSGKIANGVIISTFSSSPYYKKRFIKVVRLDSIK